MSALHGRAKSLGEYKGDRKWPALEFSKDVGFKESTEETNRFGNE
jgi:hypothetical protein